MPTSAPRVLWVTPVPPGLRGGGGHVRQAHLLEALAREATVDLVVSGGPVDEGIRDRVHDVTELDVAEDDWSGRARPARRARDVWLATGARQPREVAGYAPVRRAMAPHIDRFDGELVVVEYAGLASLVRRRRPGARWTLTLHNIASEMAAQEAAITPGARQRWLYRRDAITARRWQTSVTAAYDRVITVSEQDRRALATRVPVTVVANGVDTESFSPSPLPVGPALVFTGALYTGPNVEGIRWFCAHVLPVIRAARPGATLTVVGARPTDGVRELGRIDGVRVVADVATVVPYLRAARVALVPLRVGSGTRLKALEAMAARRPVVGTTIGLDGLGLVDGRHALFADDPAAMAAAVLRVVDDDGLAEALADEGRRLVEERYDWAAIGARFVDTVLSDRGEAQD